MYLFGAGVRLSKTGPIWYRVKFWLVLILIEHCLLPFQMIDSGGVGGWGGVPYKLHKDTQIFAVQIIISGCNPSFFESDQILGERLSSELLYEPPLVLKYVLHQ